MLRAVPKRSIISRISNFSNLLITIMSAKRKRTESKFYAVRIGMKPGIYHTWSDCLEQVKGFKGAVYKSFTSLTEAESFLSGSGPVKSSSIKFYAVKNGHKPGIYTDWPTAQKQITGILKPKHKSFTTRAEAEAFLRQVTPPPGAVMASTNIQEDAGPLMKKAKRSTQAAEHLAKEDAQGWPLGLGTLPPSYEDGNVDGFDYTLKMDETGKLKRKTAYELDATKAVPMATSKFEGQKAEEWIKVWTDGACRANGRRGAVAGVGVWFGPNDPRNVAARLPGPRQTNQRAELTALKRALAIIPMSSHVHVYSDSNYAIKCVTEWFKNWELKGWVTSGNGGKKQVENRDIVEEVLKLIREREQAGGKTKFEWVKGHAGDEGNVGADRLAVKGASMPED